MSSKCYKKSLAYKLFDTPKFLHTNNGKKTLKLVGQFDKNISQSFSSKIMYTPAMFIDGKNVYILDSLRHKSEARIQSFIAQLNQLIQMQVVESTPENRAKINIIVNNPEQTLSFNSIKIIDVLNYAVKSDIIVKLQNTCRHPSAWGTFIHNHNGVLSR